MNPLAMVTADRSGRTRHRPEQWHDEAHTSHRAPRLRAAVLGANDGLLSTSSLVVGVAAAGAQRSVLLATGVAALISGAASMAMGEYSSVSSQRDAEAADLAMEARALEDHPGRELAELTANLKGRGVPDGLAREVAEAMTEADALGAHAREELGIDPDSLARPVEAAVASAISFALGALVPILVVLGFPAGLWVPAVVVTALLGLAGLGAAGARLGGAPMVRAAVRVVLGGAAGMAVTWMVGRLFDVSVT
ncbi:MAG: VIT family protein [Acidimicrobiales bacterium]|jgi:VIT1/CCC1 family predicted Fe2+/Mn2+ transporter